MNLEFLEQFGHNHPEEYDSTLECFAHSVTAAFNRRGSILAVGCTDGRVFIWDFLTRGIAKIISAHVSQVTSLSWSRNGKLLATSSVDGYVYIWDVLKSVAIIKWNFNTAVNSVQFSPRNHNILLTNSLKQPSYLIKYEVNSDGTTSFVQKKINEDDSDYDVVSSFDRRGEYVYSGNNKGRIQVIRLEKDSINFSIVTSFRGSNTAIKQIEFSSKKKNLFLVNSVDKVIRLYDTNAVLANVNNSNSIGNNSKNINNCLDNDIDPVAKIQEQVNRSVWKKVCFGGLDSDYICAGAARPSHIYIWERSTAQLVTILQLPKSETTSDLVWHPIRPIIVCISNGVIDIMSQAQIENWSAFAPDFTELEENVEYEERESEFDEYDEDRSPVRVDETSMDEDDAEIDVVAPEKNDFLLSSDEEEEDPDALVYFPISIDIDEVQYSSEENAFDNRILSNVTNEENITK